MTQATRTHLCSAHVCLHTLACTAITASAAHTRAQTHTHVYTHMRARTHTQSTWRITHTKSSLGKLFSCCCSSPSCPPPTSPSVLSAHLHPQTKELGRTVPPTPCQLGGTLPGDWSVRSLPHPALPPPLLLSCNPVCLLGVSPLLVTLPCHSSLLLSPEVQVGEPQGLM